MSVKYRIIPIGGGGLDPSTPYGANISMTMDENYVLSVQLLDQNGDALGNEQTVDLPLESVVVSGSYDSATQSLILTLDNGNTITIPISDLISGLQAEITAQNPLSADLIVSGASNYVFTASDSTKLAGIEAGAQVNVKPDWDAAAGTAAEILNKPTIPAAANDATITIKQNGQPDQTFTLNQASNQDVTIAVGGGNAWYGTQAEFDALGTYDDDTDYFISDKIDYSEIKNKPNLGVYATKLEVNTKNVEQDNAISGKMSCKFMTQQQFDALGQNIPEGENYFIEGTTVPMVVTFQDQTTATYNLVVD